VCNFSKPGANAPSLLRHDEVCLLFHELGHAIHDLVAKTAYARFHGTAIADDICEAPSQMLERWCWTKKPLQRLSRHYSTLSPGYHAHWRSNDEVKSTTGPAEQLPDHLIEALLRSKNVNAALFHLRALWLSAFDLLIHTPQDRDTTEATDLTRLYNTMQQEIMGIDCPEDPHWSHGQAQFSHLMGSYDASYYGYL